MASRVVVPTKAYGLSYKDGGQGNVTTKDIKKLNEFLLQACDSADLFLNTNSLPAIREMHALLIAYRSHPDLFGRDASEISFENGASLIKAIRTDESMDAWKFEVGRQPPAMTTKDKCANSSWHYLNLPWVEGEDAEGDENADNLTRLTSRFNDILTDKGTDARGPPLSMLALLKYGELYSLCKSYLMKFITSPADLTDLLDAYAIVLTWKDRYMANPENMEFMFYSCALTTMMMARVLILYCAIVRNDHKKKIWKLREIPDMSIEESNAYFLELKEGYAMTWQELSDAVAASSFVKEKQYNTVVSGLRHHDPSYVVEAPVVGGICEAIITAGTIARAFGPFSLPTETQEVSSLAHNSQSLDDKEFWETLVETLTDALTLTPDI